MAKFYGKVGFVSSVESVPGVWTDSVTERDYYGDIIRQTKDWQQSNQLNDNVTIGHRISIVGDDFASLNLPVMRYVVWGEVYWEIRSFEIQRPRLILSLGGVYNGPKA